MYIVEAYLRSISTETFQRVSIIIFLWLVLFSRDVIFNDCVNSDLFCVSNVILYIIKYL